MVKIVFCPGCKPTMIVATQSECDAVYENDTKQVIAYIQANFIGTMILRKHMMVYTVFTK
jgi:hypothetical protein